MIPCSSGKLLHDFYRLYLGISNTVTNRDPDHGSLAIVQEQVYMPNKHL
jgi:hypothetical protein